MENLQRAVKSVSYADTGTGKAFCDATEGTGKVLKLLGGGDRLRIP